MFLIVGLGNPGKEYAETRHNIGFLLADRLVARYGLDGPKAKFHGELYTGDIDGVKALALKPMTFMNLSGKAVQAATSFYKIPPEQVIVLQDELDLALGKIKVKQGGGAGGHNGIKDIDAHIGPDYWRVRIGIGHPGGKEQVHGHVLSRISENERPALDGAMDAIARHFPVLLKKDAAAFLSEIHRHSPDLHSKS